MQEQHQKGELISEIHGKTVTTTFLDISQDGIKLQINDVGQLDGKIKGNHTETVTVWQKNDGTNQWETKGIEVTAEGDFIVVQGKGTGKNTSPTAPEWTGEVSYRTQSPKLAGSTRQKAGSREPEMSARASSMAKSTR